MVRLRATLMARPSLVCRIRRYPARTALCRRQALNLREGGRKHNRWLSMGIRVQAQPNHQAAKGSKVATGNDRTLAT